MYNVRGKNPLNGARLAWIENRKYGNDDDDGDDGGGKFPVGKEIAC